MAPNINSISWYELNDQGLLNYEEVTQLWGYNVTLLKSKIIILPEQFLFTDLNVQLTAKLVKEEVITEDLLDTMDVSLRGPEYDTILTLMVT